MRILYLSKALVVGAYQSKMAALAALPDIELVAAVPPSWKDERGEQRLERSATPGYELRVLPIRFNGSFHTHYYPTLGRLLDAYRPDLLHVDEEAYNLATFHAGRAAARRGIPFLFFTWQNLLRHYPPPFRWMERWCFRHAAHAIAGNHEAVGVLRAKGYGGPLSVIPQFGVELSHFPFAARDGGAPFRIGYAGRLVSEKGLTVLLDALAALDGEWQAEIVGSGPLRDELEARAARLGIGERVRLLPPRPSTEMSAFYRSLDVLVLPSRTRPNWKEQFGRVLTEAMASGAVVVGSDSGEIPNVIGDAGLVVAEGDAAALCEALQGLRRDPARRAALARAGRARVEQQFTQAAIADSTAALYRQLL